MMAFMLSANCLLSRNFSHSAFGSPRKAFCQIFLHLLESHFIALVVPASEQIGENFILQFPFSLSRFQAEQELLLQEDEFPLGVRLALTMIVRPRGRDSRQIVFRIACRSTRQLSWPVRGISYAPSGRNEATRRYFLRVEISLYVQHDGTDEQRLVHRLPAVL